MSEQSLPHPIPPPAKRPRIGTDGMVSSVGTAHLSPDLWAIVLMFLPYRDILRGTILNRTFLREVSPKVRSIRIHTASQMRATPARRFAGVTDIVIECLFQCSFDQMIFDREAVGMVVPFLCCFPALRRFSLGGLLAHAGEMHYLEYGDRVTSGRPNMENERLMRSLLIGICGAYRTGILHREARIDGILLGIGCNNTDRYDGRTDATWGDCLQCIDVCKAFPLEVLPTFDTVSMREKRPIRDRYRCQVCLSMTKILKIVLNRPGGRSVLTDPESFLEQVVLHGRRDYFSALKVLKLLPEISVSRGDVQNHMASKQYSETKARYIERWLFDELVSLGIPLRLEDFDEVE